MNSLGDRVLAVLTESAVPLKAREIAVAIRLRHRSRIERREVNRLLHGELRRLVVKDADHRWRLRPSAGQAGQGGLSRPAAARTPAAPLPMVIRPALPQRYYHAPVTEYGGVDTDVRELFLNLDRGTLRQVFRDYGQRFGPKKLEYARRTYERWKCGQVQMSGEISVRLLEIVPHHLSFDQRYQLTKKLWFGRRSRAASVTVDPFAGEDAIRREIVRVVTQNQLHDLPDELKSHLTWLTNDDAELSMRLIRQVYRDTQVVILESLTAEIRRVVDVARRAADLRVSSRHSVQLPGLTLDVILQPSRVPRGVHRMSGQNENSPKPEANLPARQPEGRDLSSFKGPGDFLEQALRHVSPEKRQELIDKAAEEMVNLGLDQKRAESHRHQAGELLDDAARTMENVSRNPNAKVQITDEVKTANRTTRVSIESKEEPKRSAHCFVATVCFGDLDHPTVVTLRSLRDDGLARFRAGRLFVAWYYANGPRLAAWVERHPRLKLPTRLALRAVATGWGVVRSV